MSKTLFDYNPVKGLTTNFTHEDGKTHLEYVQDVEPTLELAKDLAKTDDHWKEGMKREMVHAAFVPDVLIMKMLNEDGVNFYDKSQTQRVLYLLDTKYPHFKTTTKRLSRGRG